MKFNEHWNLKGKHAVFSPSQWHWVRYSQEKMIERYNSSQKAQEGTELHELASDCIKHKRRQAGDDNFAAFVNDAIGFKMNSEQALYFTDEFFGTADAISFRKQADGKRMLRIHDLKTGTTPVHMEQLFCYAALFCLEYGYNPKDIDIELRIYQEIEPIIYVGESDEKVEIIRIMKQMVDMAKVLKKIKEDE